MRRNGQMWFALSIIYSWRYKLDLFVPKLVRNFASFVKLLTIIQYNMVFN